MELFEGARCSLKRHNELVSKANSFEGIDGMSVSDDGLYWFYVPNRLMMDPIAIEKNDIGEYDEN